MLIQKVVLLVYLLFQELYNFYVLHQFVEPLRNLGRHGVLLLRVRNHF